uniref:MIR domain-containing protein n=1 Tax=Haemonchus contortus TaxID=6289 RepID=A0A7I4Y0K9_HAECO|nr:MIR domain containing protein [Haemonchus contortus]
MRWLTTFVIIVHVTLGFAYDDESITCGSVLKLSNANEGSRLHSHDVKYGSGSGQQSVTAVTASDDVNSHWQIYPALGEKCHRGDPIKCGDKIRLKHLTTGCFLHTHHFQAPLSSHYQEISCFGGDTQSDTGDNWQILCNSDEWLESDAVKIKHVDTSVYLALSGQQFGRPIHGQREVVGTDGITSGGKWKAAEGVYMKKNKD